MLLPSFQEAEGRSWKATAEQLLHVNGHDQDFTVVIFKTEGAQPSSEAKADFNAQTPFANPHCKLSGLKLAFWLSEVDLAQPNRLSPCPTACTSHIDSLTWHQPPAS